MLRTGVSKSEENIAKRQQKRRFAFFAVYTVFLYFITTLREVPSE